jgi:hypothetical protein
MSYTAICTKHDPNISRNAGSQEIDPALLNVTTPAIQLAAETGLLLSWLQGFNPCFFLLFLLYIFWGFAT